MICTFCGTENPPANRFCGMCGVRLERRKAERRENSSGSTKCVSCGHMNEPGYKFCGMCGVRFDRRMQERRHAAAGQSRATAAANAQLPTPQAHRVNLRHESPATPARAPVGGLRQERIAPSISVGGPSFLGLNDAQGEGEYLLEDERSSGRGWRALLLLVILAAIVGLIYVQWRSSWRANPRPLEQPKPQPASMPQGQKQPPPGIAKVADTVAGIQALQSAAVEMAKNITPTPTRGKTSDLATEKTNKIAGKHAAQETAEDDPPETRAAPSSVAKNQPSKALVKAQQYLHGRGVRRNCEQGLLFLQAATKENDPRAAVQMGALYSSGFCVKQDRVKAYQWFSSARDMEPDNRWIVKNLIQLWGQMTPEERHRVRSSL